MLNQILYTACITPFKADAASVNYSDLNRLIRMQESAGNGIVLLGSTGESLSLTDKEKRDIVDFVCNLSPKTEIVVGIPSHNLFSALEFLEFCNSMPITGYMMTTPIYTKPGIIGQTKWFEKLLEKAKYPSILYNIPSRAGISLHNETVKNLYGHERFVAIKDSSGTTDSIVQYKITAPNIAVYCGDDYLMPEFSAKGAAGLISVVSNCWPVQTRKYVGECLKNLADKIWYTASKSFFTASNPIPAKALMKELGMISDDCVRLPLAKEDLQSKEELIEFDKKIRNLG